MAQRCRACAHPDRARLDDVLRGKHNLARVGRDYGISRPALFRHRDAHLEATFAPLETALVATPDDPSKSTYSAIPTYREQGTGNSCEDPSVDPAVYAFPAPPKGKTVAPQDAFLTSFAASADLKAALKEAGIGRVILRQWQEHDEAFALRFHQAEAEAVENLEAEARIRAVAGSKMVRRVYRHGMLYEEIHEFRPSDAMLVKLLQAAKPEKYGDKLTVTQTTVVKAIAEDAWSAV